MGAYNDIELSKKRQLKFIIKTKYASELQVVTLFNLSIEWTEALKIMRIEHKLIVVSSVFVTCMNRIYLRQRHR
jgi:hypothetical protein